MSQEYWEKKQTAELTNEIVQYDDQRAEIFGHFREMKEKFPRFSSILPFSLSEQIGHIRKVENQNVCGPAVPRRNNRARVSD